MKGPVTAICGTCRHLRETTHPTAGAHYMACGWEVKRPACLGALNWGLHEGGRWMSRTNLAAGHPAHCDVWEAR